MKENNDPMIGIGGAPTRVSTLPTDAKERKKYPIGSGVLDYFPDALAEVSNISYAGNEQHNPGQPLHWARGKSTDEWDTMIRHGMQRGTRDTDGKRHSAKMVWRALAILQKEIEEDNNILRAKAIERERLEQEFQGQVMLAKAKREEERDNEQVGHQVLGPSQACS